MENIVIDLRLKVQQLEVENKALKTKIDIMYKNWLFDSKQYSLLKEKYKELFNHSP